MDSNKRLDEIQPQSISPKALQFLTAVGVEKVADLDWASEEYLRSFKNFPEELVTEVAEGLNRWGLQLNLNGIPNERDDLEQLLKKAETESILFRLTIAWFIYASRFDNSILSDDIVSVDGLRNAFLDAIACGIDKSEALALADEISSIRKRCSNEMTFRIACFLSMDTHNVFVDLNQLIEKETSDSAMGELVNYYTQLYFSQVDLGEFETDSEKVTEVTRVRDLIAEIFQSQLHIQPKMTM